MKNIFKLSFLIYIFSSQLSFAATKTSQNGTQKIEDTKRKVAESYVHIARQLYNDTVTSVDQMLNSIEKFVVNPSGATHEDAKDAWIASRNIYGKTEAFRFYDGPIDDSKTGVEGFVNGWPIDESYIDYVKENANSGIVNSVKEYPTINEEVLMSANTKGGEKNISTGYHAIEFLLWGQDFYADSPGKRSFTDYQKGKVENAERRGIYLVTLTRLLKKHLEQVRDAWSEENKHNYGKSFLLEKNEEALKKILIGMTNLSLDELAGERLTVVYEKRDQENEQSCFSDTTANDFVANQDSISVIWNGRYGRYQGASLRDLAKVLDPKLEKEISNKVAQAEKAVKAIPTPFDTAVTAKTNTPGRKNIKKAIDSLESQARSLAKLGKRLGIELNVQ